MICWKDRINSLIMLFISSSIIFSVSCKKENPDKDTVGSGVVGKGFDLKVDTLDVIAFSSVADSIDTRFLNYYLLGHMNDPVLGKTTANMILQCGLPFNNFSLGDAIIDSVVLQIRFAGATSYYGDITANQQITLYEITEDLPTATNNTIWDYYLSNRNYNHSATPLGTFNAPFNFKDSIIITVGNNVIKTSPSVRIKITDTDFISRLQNAKDSTDFNTEETFKKAFKGFYISAEQAGLTEGQGALAYMHTKSTETALILYTHRQENGQAVYSKYDFPISRDNSVKANQYKHEYKPALQHRLNGTHQNESYVQGAAGITTRILIPGLIQFVQQHNIAVTNANLIISTKDTTTYAAPRRLVLNATDEKGNTVISPDQYEFNQGGYHNPEKGIFSFNANRYTQNVLNTYYQTKKDVNYGLAINIPYNSTVIDDARRVVFNTDKSNPADLKIKFVITYAVIK
jgi:hypothetical protein